MRFINNDTVFLVALSVASLLATFAGHALGSRRPRARRSVQKGHADE